LDINNIGLGLLLEHFLLLTLNWSTELANVK